MYLLDRSGIPEANLVGRDADDVSVFSVEGVDEIYAPTGYSSPFEREVGKRSIPGTGDLA